MKEKDIRWIQRFANYKKALTQLNKFIVKKELNELEKQGLIQAFEYTYELAWNTIKDFYEYQGESGIQGSRDAFRLGVNRGLLTEGETWMDMIQSRQRTSHSYNEETANEIADKIIADYYGLFNLLLNSLEAQETETGSV